MFDAYEPLLRHVLFPAFEAVRGRPTVGMQRYLQQTQWWPEAQLVDLQLGALRKLLHHAHAHTAYYREVMNARGLHAGSFQTLADLNQLPLLTREIVQQTEQTRSSNAPPRATIRKFSSGTTGQPVVICYDEGSRHWRDAIRLRGWGWAGYSMGRRHFHYWGQGSSPPPTTRVGKLKLQLDHTLKRDCYVDSTPQGEAPMRAALAELVRFRPHVIIAYAQAIAALARFVNDQGLRTWDDIPVLCGAERLWPHDREAITKAFGPAFETYGSREVMLIGAECEHHDGMHLSMESLIVELIVRQPDGSTRAAAPGEVGEVAITDLRNLGCPMIRYVTGDLATARDATPCPCGRGLRRIGPIDGRVTEALTDGNGHRVDGIVFSLLFARIADAVTHFQVVQKADRRIILRVVPKGADIPQAIKDIAHAHIAKYLPGVPFELTLVNEIPVSKAGKRRIVVVEKTDEMPS